MDHLTLRLPLDPIRNGSFWAFFFFYKLNGLYGPHWPTKWTTPLSYRWELNGPFPKCTGVLLPLRVWLTFPSERKRLGNPMVDLVPVAEPDLCVHFISFSFVSVKVSRSHNGDMRVFVHMNSQLLDRSRLELPGKVYTEALETVVVVTASQAQIFKLRSVEKFFKDCDFIVIIIVRVENVQDNSFDNILESSGQFLVNLLLRQSWAVAHPDPPVPVVPGGESESLQRFLWYFCLGNADLGQWIVFLSLLAVFRDSFIPQVLVDALTGFVHEEEETREGYCPLRVRSLKYTEIWYFDTAVGKVL